MSEELSSKVISIMEREMSSLGRTMLEKECQSLEIVVEDIHPEELPAIASRMSELMKTCGGYEKARKVYSEIRKLQDLDELAESQDSEEARIEMQENLATASIYAGEWAKALGYLTKLLKKAGNVDARLRYMRLLGLLHKDKSEYALAMTHLRKALKEGMRSGNKTEISRINSLMGDVYWFTGYHQLAEECHQRAIETAASKEDLAVAHIGIANVYNNRLDFAKAITHYVEALVHLKGSDDYRQIARAYNNLGDVYLQMKEWENALENLEKGREISELGKNAYIKGYCLHNAAEALIHLGRLEEADEMLTESIEIFKVIGNSSGLAGAYNIAGLLARTRKDWPTMIKEYRRAIDEYATHEIPHYGAKTRHDLALGYLDMGEKAKAKMQLELALETYTDLNLEKSSEQLRKELDGLG